MATSKITVVDIGTQGPQGPQGPSYSFDIQIANLLFVGPASGAAAAPTFRAMVAADLGTTLSPTFAGLTLTAFSGAVIATAGVLSAGTLGATIGGTGQTVFAVGDLLYASTTTALSKLADVAAGAYLRSGGVNTAPLWSTLILPNAATAFRLPVATSANTIGELAAVGATGEYLKGNTGAIPSWATLNQAAVAGLTTASSPTFAGLVVPGISPAADFVLTQNSVAVMTSVGASAVVNTLYLKEGKVGIGTIAPRTLLDVVSGIANTAGDTPSVAIITGPNEQFTNCFGTLSLQSNASFGADHGATLGFAARHTGTQSATFAMIKGAKENAVESNTAGYLIFGTRPAGAVVNERMRIDSAGNVGIGTTSPGAKLDISSGQYNPATGPIALSIGADLQGYGKTDNTRKIAFVGSPHYDTDASPVAILYQDNNVTENILLIGGGNGYYNAATRIGFWTAANTTTAAGTESLSITNSGNVGIGTTNPSELLTLAQIKALYEAVADGYSAALRVDPAYIGDGIVASISIGNGGSGYSVNDVLTVVQSGGSGCTVTVTSVAAGVVDGVSLTTGGTGYEVANNLATTVAPAGGTGCLINIVTLTTRTVTRHNYIDVQNMSLTKGALLTDAAVFRFDAAIGTHKAVDAASTKTTPSGVDAWMKVNLNGVIGYVPVYLSKTA